MTFATKLWVPQPLAPHTLLSYKYPNSVYAGSRPSRAALPSYNMVGGLVFTSLSKEYLREYKLEDWDVGSLGAWTDNLRLLARMGLHKEGGWAASCIYHLWRYPISYPF